MDTDDISKLERFEKQLTYIANHPEVAVLGTCIEEFSKNINAPDSATILPLTHDEIVKFSKKRNPFRHRLCVLIEVLRFSLMLLCLIVVVFLIKGSVYFLLLTNFIVSIIVVLVTQFLLQKFIGYTLQELVVDIFPSFIMSIMIVFLVKWISWTGVAEGIVLLCMQIVAAVMLYIISSIFSKNSNFMMVYQYYMLRTSQNKNS